jgi:threonine dehydrogenase-like Zn-dependent dehydrogenase
VWGCGPVGLFAVQSAFLMGAQRVIAIDHFPHRLELAAKFGAETINFEESKVYEALQDMTGGIGPDASIDCVGLEAHGAFADNIIDQLKASTFLGTDRAHSIRQVIMCTRKGGRVSMPAVYGGFIDKFPLGAFMEKGLTLKTGQTHVQKYLRPLYTAIAEGKIDSTFLISHRMALDAGPDGYKMFHDKQNEYTKVVLKPGLLAA